MEVTKTKPWEVQGAAMQAWMNGNKRAALKVENAFGMVPVPISIYFRDIDEMPELEHYALTLCKGHTLDAGAGSGCHSLALQELDMDVTAIDIGQQCCWIMEQRGVDNVVCGSIFDLSDPQFDTVLMLMNGTGLGGTPEVLKKLLKHLHKLVAPGGQVLCDSTDIDMYMPGWDSRILGSESGLKLARPGVLEHILRYGELESEVFPWLYLRSSDFSKIARASGWQFQVVFESDDGHYLARLWH